MGRIAQLMERAEPIAKRKGWKGTSSAWMGIYIVSFAYRHLHKRLAAEPVVLRETILPGQQLVISHYPKGAEPPEPVKVSRRAAKRTAKRDRRAAKELAAARKAEEQAAKADAKVARAAAKAAKKAASDIVDG